ncbi:MAG: C39 family peptidase [Selenomonadaceae bacterium]|nr:C39 family peptidase [Selenomonadaceae bacterium]
MKKIFAAAILTTALFIGCASAEDVESSGAASAPKEINHADSIYYPQIDFYNMTSTADRIILPHYPTYQQTTEYSCGAAAALTVLNYFGDKSFDEPTLIKLLKTKPKIGTSLGNMVKFFKGIGWDVQSSLDTPPFDEYAFQKFVIENLSAGKPIIVENVDWGGHWRVIIGYDSLETSDLLYDDVLIFADPYDTSDHNQDGYAIQSFDRFFSMWFDNHILPEKERNQAWLIATPKGDN